MKAVIMAGGEGVRLRPFTYMLPKPFLPVGDSTVFEHIIQNLKNCGFDDICISVNYQAKQFRKCLEYREKYGVKIQLSRERKKLGTAGALFNLKRRLKESFCLINGDLLTRTRLDRMHAFHERRNADITMGIKKHDVVIPYAVIQKNALQRLARIKEKPSYRYHINAGIYMLNPRVLRLLRRERRLDMPALIELVRRSSGKVFVYDIGEYWLDIGHLTDYENALDVIQTWKD